MSFVLQSLLLFVHAIGRYTLMVWEIFCSCFLHFPKWHLLRDQLFHMGVLSFTVVAFTGFSTGSVLATQAFFQLADKGLAGATGIMVAKSMIIELGPVLTAFMVTGRVGAAICAEIGTMKVTEQLDAMRSMSIHPLHYLITPRFLAGSLMVPLLSIFSMITGILGGYLISVFVFHMAPVDFFLPIPSQVQYFDIFSGLAKSFVFGVLIITIACFKGIHTKGGAAGVGKSTTNSVVITYVSILLFNFFLTFGMYTLKQLFS